MFEPLFLAAAFFLPLVLALVALSRARRLEAELTQELKELKESVESLRTRLYELKRETRAPPQAPEAAQSSPPPVAFAPPARTAAPPVPEPSPAPPPSEAPAPQPPPVVPPAAPTSEATPPPREAPAPFAPPAPPPPSGRGGGPIDWEGFVGVRLFSWIAAVFLTIGAVFFLRYSIEQGWLSAPVRMALGFLVGVGLLVACEWKAARRYPVTANALDGAGIAILFSTAFASHALWHLIGIVPAFALMALVTAVAVALSVRRDSVFIALLGLVGGFAAPALLSTGEDRPIGLFGYLLLLNGGLAWLAYRKRWAYLSVLSLVFTTLYQWAWVVKFLTEAKLGLAAGIFLVFPVLSVFALLRFPKGEARADDVFGRTATAGAALPLLFALLVAAVPAYGSHWPLLFGVLLALSLGLATLAAVRGPGELHALGGLATLVVFGTWLAQTAHRPPLLVVAALVAPFVLCYLFAGTLAARAGRPYGEAGASAAYAAPLLLFVFPVLVGVDAASAEPALVFAPLLALAVIVAVAARLQDRPFLHVAAAFFVIGAEAAWILARLVPANLFGALAVVAVFGLFYMAVPLAEQNGPGGGGGSAPVRLLAISGLALLVLVATKGALTSPPWPVLGVLVLLTVAGSLTGIRLGEATLAGTTLAVSQLVVLALELGRPEAPMPRVAVFAAATVGLWGLALFFLSRLKERAAPALVGLFLAQAVVVFATLLPGSPPVGILLAAHVVLVAAILVVAASTEWHVVAVLVAASSAVAAAVFQAGGEERGTPGEHLLLAGVLFGLSLAYPLLLGRRAGRAHEPYLAAVLASVAFFFLARSSFLAAGWDNVIGALPVAEALLLAVLLVRLLRLGIPAKEDATRLALVAGTILAFVAVAIPLQLENEWITIGWALLAASLAWLYTRIPHGGLVATSAGLYAAVFVRLVVNPAVLTYHPRAATPFWNWYLYTYLVPAVAFFFGARLLARSNGEPPANVEPLLAGLRWILPSGGTVLLFLLLNIEIADFFSTGLTPTFRFLSATLAEGLSYTLCWAVFAVALLVSGIVLRASAARIAAVALLLVTVFKCFLFDLSRLGGLYRVASFVGLAASLAAVALLLQRFVLRGRKETA
jgi:uncharacterized membrane protein